MHIVNILMPGNQTSIYPALVCMHAHVHVCTANTQHHMHTLMHASTAQQTTHTHLDAQTQAEGHASSSVYPLTLGN